MRSHLAVLVLIAVAPAALGDLQPIVTTSFLLYDGRGEEPVWHDNFAKGVRLEEGAEHWVGVADVTAVKKLSLKAMPSSFARLISRMKEEG